MHVTIRDAEVDDAAVLGAVHVRAWQAAYRNVMPDDYLEGLDAEQRGAGWRRHLTAVRTADEHLLVVLADDTAVGFAAAGPARDTDLSDDVGELYSINLDPDVWGRGLGRKLLRIATDRLARSGYAEAVLWVVPENDRARALYESEGWGDDGLARDEEIQGVIVPEMRYRRRLVQGAVEP